MGPSRELIRNDSMCRLIHTTNGNLKWKSLRFFMGIRAVEFSISISFLRNLARDFLLLILVMEKHYSLVDIATLPLAYDTTCIYAIDIIIVFDRFVVVLVRGLLLIAV